MPGSRPYRFHPQAWQEVEAADDWYRQRNPEASVRFLSALYDGLENIARWPNRWLRYQLGTRRFILYRFPFSIIYRVEPTELSVVAVSHHKRKPGYWKGRL
jgi:plasmid stabilization system protein ParE